MVVHEFRIPLPLSVEEFGKGQRVMVAETSIEHMSGDEGIEWIKNEPYDNTDGHMGTSPITGTVVPRNKGQYTLKRYHFKSRIPGILAALAPGDALFLVEEAWNSYPHCKTVLVNGYLAITTMRIDVESLHVDGSLDLDNAIGLTPAELKQRKVEYLDVLKAHHDPAAKDYKPEHDLSKFKSAKTGRGPLTAGWERSGMAPMMCCYKVVRADFKIFGLQGTGENLILSQQRGIFQKTLCQAFATIDTWVGMTPEDILKMEEEVARRSNEQLQKTVASAAKVPGHDAAPGASGGGK